MILVNNFYFPSEKKDKVKEVICNIISHHNIYIFPLSNNLSPSLSFYISHKMIYLFNKTCSNSMESTHCIKDSNFVVPTVIKHVFFTILLINQSIILINPLTGIEVKNFKKCNFFH